MLCPPLNCTCAQFGFPPSARAMGLSSLFGFDRNTLQLTVEDMLLSRGDEDNNPQQHQQHQHQQQQPPGSPGRQAAPGAMPAPATAPGAAGGPGPGGKRCSRLLDFNEPPQAAAQAPPPPPTHHNQAQAPGASAVTQPGGPMGHVHGQQPGLPYFPPPPAVTGVPPLPGLPSISAPLSLKIEPLSSADLPSSLKQVLKQEQNRGAQPLSQSQQQQQQQQHNPNSFGCVASEGPQGGPEGLRQGSGSSNGDGHQASMTSFFQGGPTSSGQDANAGTPGNLAPMQDPYQAQTHTQPRQPSRLGPGVSLVVKRQQQPQPSAQPQPPPPLQQQQSAPPQLGQAESRDHELVHPPSLQQQQHSFTAPQQQPPTGQGSYPMQPLSQSAIQAMMASILGPARGTVGKPDELAAAAAPGSVPSRARDPKPHSADADPDWTDARTPATLQRPQRARPGGPAASGGGPSGGNRRLSAGTSGGFTSDSVAVPYCPTASRYVMRCSMSVLLLACVLCYGGAVSLHLLPACAVVCCADVSTFMPPSGASGRGVSSVGGSGRKSRMSDRWGREPYGPGLGASTCADCAAKRA